MQIDFHFPCEIAPSGTAHVVIATQLVSENWHILRETVRELLYDGRCVVALDFRRCVYIDSSGLGVLVGIRRKIIEAGGELTIAGLNEDLRALFDLTKLAPLFGTEPIVAVSR